MSTFRVSDGTRLHFDDVGSGRPIVFIHGWPLSGAMWEYQITTLARSGFRCIAYDRRGFGRSDQPGTGYDYDTLGRDLADLVEHLDLEDATLAGFSMGGGEVVEYLTRHNAKRRVTRALLISSIVPFLLKTADNPDGVDASVFRDMQAALLSDRPAFLTDFAEKFFGVGLVVSPVSMPMLAATCEVAMHASPIATLECVTTFSHTDFRKAAKSISVPTLVIHGDADKTVPIDPTGACAANIIPTAELKIYSGAPHGLFFTHKADLNRDISAFVSDGEIALAAAE